MSKVEGHHLHLADLLENPSLVVSISYDANIYERCDGVLVKERPSITIHYNGEFMADNGNGVMMPIWHFGCTRFYMPEEGITWKDKPCIRTKCHGANHTIRFVDTKGTDVLNQLITIVEDKVCLSIEEFTSGTFCYWR